jgi:hypothetical protein
MVSWRAGCGWLAASVVVLGCGQRSGGGGEEWRAVRDTIGDTLVVRTVSGSVWGGPAMLVQEVTIGVFEGADEYMLGDPTSFAVAPDRSVVILDSQVPVVRVYNADGTHRTDVSRQGGGPGEYGSPDAVAVLPDGRILVRDPKNQRVSLFDLDGGYLGYWPHPGGFNTSRRFFVDHDGHSYASTILERGTAPWEWRFGLIRRDADGVVLDTVPAPAWDYSPAQLRAAREGSSAVRSVPFSPQVAWTFSPLGYVVGGLSTDYRIDLFKPGGTVLRIEREASRVAVQPAEADERRRQLTESLRRQYGAWRWNGPPIPDTKPPFRELVVSDEGDIWVEVSVSGVLREGVQPTDADGRVQLRYWEPPAFEVFAADGRFLGTVRVPEGLRVDPEPVVRGDRIWAVFRDEMDLPTLRRLRIVKGGPSEAAGTG